jgi:hypothetical protein
MVGLGVRGHITSTKQNAGIATAASAQCAAKPASDQPSISARSGGSRRTSSVRKIRNRGLLGPQILRRRLVDARATGRSGSRRSVEPLGHLAQDQLTIAGSCIRRQRIRRTCISSRFVGDNVRFAAAREGGDLPK